MSAEFFIAKRILFNKEGKKSFSRPMVQVAIGAISLGLAIMIISLSVTRGFKEEIKSKALGFSSDFRIQNVDLNEGIETNPIEYNDSLQEIILQTNGVSSVQPFAIKIGLAKTENVSEAIILNGVDKDFDWSFIKDNLKNCNIIDLDSSFQSNEIVISNNLSKKLNVNIGEKLKVFFLIDNVSRARVFKVIGVFETGLSDLENNLSYININHIRKLNNWEENQVGGLNVYSDNDKNKNILLTELENKLIYNVASDGSMLEIIPVEDLYPEIFSWLEMLDLNLIVILVLMIIVAGFNIISALLIIIIEKVRMIGVLKSIGYSNFSIRKIFLWNSLYLILKGVFWGNLLGIILILIQDKFKIIELDSSNYFVTVVPVKIEMFDLFLLNIFTVAIVLIIVLIPSYLVSLIQPVKVMRFN